MADRPAPNSDFGAGLPVNAGSKGSKAKRKNVSAAVRDDRARRPKKAAAWRPDAFERPLRVKDSLKRVEHAGRTGISRVYQEAAKAEGYALCVYGERTIWHNGCLTLRR